MDDSYCDPETGGTPEKAQQSPPAVPIVGNISQDNKPDRQARKYRCCRKLRKAPIWIEAICAVCLVGITGTYTYYAKRQVELTQDALYAGDRPWIGIKNTTYALNRLQCTVKNYGRTVARKIVVRAYWIDEKDLTRWEQPASHEEEYDLKFLKICDDAVTESRTYGLRRSTIPGRYGAIFPDELVSIDNVPIGDQLRQSNIKQFVAVCIAYQGIEAALAAPTKPERHPLFVSAMFRTQALYRTTPTDELKMIDSEAWDPFEVWRIKK